MMPSQERRSDRRSARLLSNLFLVFGIGCAPLAPTARYEAQAQPSLDHVETALLLAGDAGNPARTHEPVLTALEREASRAPSRTVVVFLGDNVYPDGLPIAGSPSRGEAERRLDAQLAVIGRSGARGIFIPGNHDWGGGMSGGFKTVLRQEEYVVARGGSRASFLPRGGCPGPSVQDIGSRLRLVILDTNWWLHGGPKPMHPASACATDSENEIIEAVRTALGGGNDRRIIVLGHHPLVSGGRHGGHFGWTDHIFPLRGWNGCLFLPMPGVGSLYAVMRSSWGMSQDLSSPAYTKMRLAIEAAFQPYPPLAYASGHEHNLQVLDGRMSPHLLISGAGIYGRTSPVARIDETRFALSRGGFMRLDILSTGRILLNVLAVDRKGSASSVFSLSME